RSESRFSENHGLCRSHDSRGGSEAHAKPKMLTGGRDSSLARPSRQPKEGCRETQVFRSLGMTIPVAQRKKKPASLRAVVLANWCGLLNQVSVLGADFLFRNNNGRGDAVALVEMQQAHALSGTSRFSNLLGLNADDLAELADHHAFRRLGHEHDG